jgi:hypothetical protein
MDGMGGVGLFGCLDAAFSFLDFLYSGTSCLLCSRISFRRCLSVII